MHKFTRLNSKITSFTGSLSDLYNAFVAKGVTPSAKTLSAMVDAVNTLYNKAYSEGKVYNLGQVTSVNVATLFPDTYKTMTSANFALVLGSVSAGAARNAYKSGHGSGSISPKITYNASTGTVSVSGTAWSDNTGSYEAYISKMSVSFTLYVFATIPTTI